MEMLSKHYFCPIPFNKMKMKNLPTLMALAALSIVAGCGKLGKSSKGLPNDGQLHGVAPASKYNLTKPPGMIYIPPGTFHMGPSDEDVNYAYTARNKQISINGFWMDATEITNNEYRQFVNWVRDSIAATLMQYGKEVDGQFRVDWKKAQTIKWADKATIEKIDQMIVTPENRIFGKKELDPEKTHLKGST
jgi:formylglycine-generating enzyme